MVFFKDSKIISISYRGLVRPQTKPERSEELQAVDISYTDLLCLFYLISNIVETAWQISSSSFGGSASIFFLSLCFATARI